MFARAAQSTHIPFYRRVKLSLQERYKKLSEDADLLWKTSEFANVYPYVPNAEPPSAVCAAVLKVQCTDTIQALGEYVSKFISEDQQDQRNMNICKVFGANAERSAEKFAPVLNHLGLYAEAIQHKDYLICEIGSLSDNKRALRHAVLFPGSGTHLASEVQKKLQERFAFCAAHSKWHPASKRGLEFAIEMFANDLVDMEERLYTKRQAIRICGKPRVGKTAMLGTTTVQGVQMGYKVLIAVGPNVVEPTMAAIRVHEAMGLSKPDPDDPRGRAPLRIKVLNDEENADAIFEGADIVIASFQSHNRAECISKAVKSSEYPVMIAVDEAHLLVMGEETRTLKIIKGLLDDMTAMWVLCTANQLTLTVDADFRRLLMAIPDDVHQSHYNARLVAPIRMDDDRMDTMYHGLDQVLRYPLEEEHKKEIMSWSDWRPATKQECVNSGYWPPKPSKVKWGAYNPPPNENWERTHGFANGIKDVYRVGTDGLEAKEIPSLADITGEIPWGITGPNALRAKPVTYRKHDRTPCGAAAFFTIKFMFRDWMRRPYNEQEGVCDMFLSALTTVVNGDDGNVAWLKQYIEWGRELGMPFAAVLLASEADAKRDENIGTLSKLFPKIPKMQPKDKLSSIMVEGNSGNKTFDVSFRKDKNSATRNTMLYMEGINKNYDKKFMKLPCAQDAIEVVHHFAPKTKIFFVVGQIAKAGWTSAWTHVPTNVSYQVNFMACSVAVSAALECVVQLLGRMCAFTAKPLTQYLMSNRELLTIAVTMLELEDGFSRVEINPDVTMSALDLLHECWRKMAASIGTVDRNFNITTNEWRHIACNMKHSPRKSELAEHVGAKIPQVMAIPGNKRASVENMVDRRKRQKVDAEAAQAASLAAFQAADAERRAEAEAEDAKRRAAVEAEEYAHDLAEANYKYRGLFPNATDDELVEKLREERSETSSDLGGEVPTNDDSDDEPEEAPNAPQGFNIVQHQARMQDPKMPAALYQPLLDAYWESLGDIKNKQRRMQSVVQIVELVLEDKEQCGDKGGCLELVEGTNIDVTKPKELLPWLGEHAKLPAFGNYMDGMQGTTRTASTREGWQQNCFNVTQTAAFKAL